MFKNNNNFVKSTQSLWKRLVKYLWKSLFLVNLDFLECNISEKVTGIFKDFV